MKRLCMWLVCAFLCLFGCVSAACAKTTPLMDDELFYYYTPEGLQFSDDSYEKKDGLLSVEIDDDETDWASAIAWIANVVLPEDSGPYISMILPFG